MTKERSLILRDWEARAIIDGRKTMLRRAVNIAKYPCVDWGYAKNHVGLVVGLCPFGQPGDRLWVREAWQYYTDGIEQATYRATHPNPDSIRWRPSIYMPRAFARIALEVVAVRVERLQDITEADARAEGHLPVVREDGAVDCGTRKTNFVKQWESDHGPKSWGQNPWVWVVEFRQVIA